MTSAPRVDVDDHEVVGRDRAQADRVGRIRLVRPLPVCLAVRALGAMHQAALLQNAEHLLHVVAAVLFARRERQLEGRALHVIDEDVQVVGIDQRVLGRRVEEVRRIAGRRTDRAARCCATSTAAERPLRRPARPARCHVAAIVPG